MRSGQDRGPANSEHVEQKGPEARTDQRIARKLEGSMPSQRRQTIDTVFWFNYGETAANRLDIMGKSRSAKLCIAIEELGKRFAHGVEGMAGSSSGKVVSP
jgi:hypothetical protein